MLYLYVLMRYTRHDVCALAMCAACSCQFVLYVRPVDGIAIYFLWCLYGYQVLSPRSYLLVITTTSRPSWLLGGSLILPFAANPRERGNATRPHLGVSPLLNLGRELPAAGLPSHIFDFFKPRKFTVSGFDFLFSIIRTTISRPRTLKQNLTPISRNCVAG